MGRGILVIALALALGACRGADDRAPFAESRAPAPLADRFLPPPGWTWGYLQLGDGPVQRYGVASPAVTPRADVLILPDYGETAETWFETVRDLTARGYTVWVLEAVGQGGSERLVGRRDLGHVKSFEPDAAAVRAMANRVIRPKKALVVIGQGVGATIALRAAQTGLAPAGLVLSAPVPAPPAKAQGPLRMLGLGTRRAPGAGGWSRRDAFSRGLTHDPWRGAVTVSWQAANPDLRMGGPSLDWIAAYADAAAAARRDAARATSPVLMLDAGGGPAVPAGCSRRTWPAAGRALELESDPVRTAWLDAIDGFIRGRLDGSPCR